MNHRRQLFYLLLLTLLLVACSQTLTDRPQDDLEPQIVNGRVSVVGSRPYQVKLDIRSPDGQGGYLCGGTLLSSTWVMTAAHCVTEENWVSPASGVTVYAGRYKLDTGGQTVMVSRVIVHPQYQDDAIEEGYDIALLKLATAITHPLAAPAAIPGNAAHAAMMRQKVTISGWGGTENGSTEDLREIIVPLFEGPQCGQQATQVCNIVKRDGVLVNGGKDVAPGDSGGPVAGRYNNKFYVLGVASYIIGNDEESDSVYTRVNSFRTWIQTKTGIAPDGAGSSAYRGTLQSGANSLQPSTGFSYADGTLIAKLTGPQSSNFNLFLQKKNGSTWQTVARSTTPDSSEAISYTATSGTYRWRVYSVSGNGTFNLTETK
jgi:trypsin